MYPKMNESSFVHSNTWRSIFLSYGQGVKGYRLYDKAQKNIFYNRNVAFNETRSTKQDDFKDVAKYELSIELEMDCQSEDDNTINHHADDEPQQERRERGPPRYGE